MAIETDEGFDFRTDSVREIAGARGRSGAKVGESAAGATSEDVAAAGRVRPRLYAIFSMRTWFSSLTRRIFVFNLAALVILASGILYLNQFRAGLIDARVQGLLTQGEIIAGAVAASATMDAETVTIDPDRLLDLQAGQSLSPFTERAENLTFPINPERAAPILWQLISPTRTQAHLYDREGELLVDSRNLFAGAQITRFELEPIEQSQFTAFLEAFQRGWQRITTWLRQGDLPLQDETPLEDGRQYPEVVAALGGAPVSTVRVNKQGELIVIVAVPVQRFRAVLGALVLSTQGGDIDSMVAAERWAIFRVFLVAAGVTVLLSIMLASTIVEPMRRLAAAAERVRNGVRAREEIPDFTARGDEIGHLSGSLRDMTHALYDRIEAIESFAADVAHELKNPLTSLRSATETLPLAKSEDAHARLIKIIQDDVKRLDRLISDISAASRLDAELAREDMEPVDIAKLLGAVVSVANDLSRPDMPDVSLEISETKDQSLEVLGQDSRLGRVINNLIDNARSFAPPQSTVKVLARRRGAQVEIRVEDSGPGIEPDNLKRIFERFYTDRPHPDAFGQNSGLGLSISQQIISAHDGMLYAENIYGDGADATARAAGNPTGARFVVRLPARSA